MITLYILGGCVAVAVLLFVVMIVLSVLRPPQLPEISVDAPPLQRFIRALTPAPIATAPIVGARSIYPAPVQARPAAAPVRPQPPAPPPSPPPTKPVLQPPPAKPLLQPPPARPQPQPQQPPRRAQPPPPPAAKPVAPPAAKPVAPPAAKPVAPPAARAHRPPVAFTRPPYAAPAPFARPIYPARRSRVLVRGFVALLLTTMAVAGTVVAYPALLDPLCDDYVWFGADAAALVRDHAREANAVLADAIYTALGH